MFGLSSICGVLHCTPLGYPPCLRVNYLIFNSLRRVRCL